MLFTLIIGVTIIITLTIVMTEFREMARVTLFGSPNNASQDGGATAFVPARDIPSLVGKVVLITGAAGDLGRQTAIELARYGRPARIYVADLPRDDDTKKALVRQITYEAYGDSQSDMDVAGPHTEIRFLELDLSSLDNVRKCAADFVAQEKRLDILILNAGIIRVRPGVTREGYEIHFGINYLGHALLSRLLVPKMLLTAQQQPGTDLKTNCADMHYAKRYGQSKVALIGLTRELSREYPQFKAVAVHPGRILTGMATSLQKESTLARLTKHIAPLFCVPVLVGIRNHLWAATSPHAVSGTYYEPVGVPGKLSPAAKDESLSKRLREWTDNAVSGIKSLE
ncbi:hypothetical protein DL765_008541 [Monosporascus sp. GIB2]|nr:hypothetical protein DL765_008541 [Monosporascus sp. GIB2]